MGYMCILRLFKRRAGGEEDETEHVLYFISSVMSGRPRRKKEEAKYPVPLNADNNNQMNHVIVAISADDDVGLRGSPLEGKRGHLIFFLFFCVVL